MQFSLRAKLVDLSFGIIIVLFLSLNFIYGNLHKVLGEFLAFMSGRVDLVIRKEALSWPGFWEALGIMSIDILISVAIFNFVSRVLKSRGYSSALFLSAEQAGAAFKFTVLAIALVILEEIVLSIFNFL